MSESHVNSKKAVPNAAFGAVSSQYWRDVLEISFILLYAAFAIAFFVWIAGPYLDNADIQAPRLLADSITYASQCPDRDPSDWFWWRDAGPCMALDVFNGNLALVSIMNATIIVISAKKLASCYGLRGRLVLCLMLINPITFLSLFGPNKEVFGLAATVFLLIYFRQRSITPLLTALALAFCTRIYMLAVVAAFVLLAWPFLSRVSAARTSRAFLILATICLLGATILAKIINTEAQILILGDVSDAEDNSQSTIFSLALEPLSSYGLYVVTYALRLVLNLYGALANIVSASLATHGVYYVFGVIGSSLLFLLMTLANFSKRSGRLIRLNSQGLEISVFALFFTLVLCTSPVIQHRYFFPLYSILVLTVASKWTGALKREVKPLANR